MKENAWATMDTIIDEPADLHIGGTIPKKRGLEFWLSFPCPKGVSLDDWEGIQQAKWDRIFGKKEG